MILFFQKQKKDIESIENNWRTGRHMLRRINCRSENSKGVYCLQYDDVKIVSGLRDNTIKIWDRTDLQCVKVLKISRFYYNCYLIIHFFRLLLVTLVQFCVYNTMTKSLSVVHPIQRYASGTLIPAKWLIPSYITVRLFYIYASIMA